MTLKPSQSERPCQTLPISDAKRASQQKPFYLKKRRNSCSTGLRRLPARKQEAPVPHLRQTLLLWLLNRRTYFHLYVDQ